MRGKRAKMLRKVFKDPLSYDKAKHAYNRASLKEKIEAKEAMQEILDRDKPIKEIKK